MVPFHSRMVRLGETELTVEAILNNCSDLWTATARAGEALIATAAGSTPEAAMDAVIERAERVGRAPSRA